MTLSYEKSKAVVDGDLFFGKFSYLLGSLVFLLVAASFTGKDRISGAVLCLLLTGVLFVSAVTICRHHGNLFPALLITFPTLLFSWLGFAMPSRGILLIHNLLFVLFFAFVAYHVLYSVLSDKQVTLDSIRGAVCIYVLVGLAWAYVYGTIMVLDADAIQVPDKISEVVVSPFGNSSFSQTAYYSFVTMTTLGYGDIRPVSSPARTAAILQAIFGQFYLAVLVARLVVLHIKFRDEA